MRGVKHLLVPVIVTAALVGLSLPASADPGARPVESPVASEDWGPSRRVPVPKDNIAVLATAISDHGHIAVAYSVGWRIREGRVPGYVIVRGPRGVWGAPHRLNPRNTVINDVELAFDARGNLTAFWSFDLGPPTPPPPIGYAVATKPANRAWSSHVRAGPVKVQSFRRFVLSVEPSGMSVIGWWQLDPDGGLQFTVRVRATAGAAWGRAQALSSFPPAWSDGNVSGDVAMRDDGTAIAAWKACRPGPGVASCTLQRSELAVSGVWTTPMTMATKVFQYVPVEVASTPDGFTAITWVRRHNGRWRTVVALQVAGENWSREVMGGAHDSLVVGPGETVAMIKRNVSKGGGYLAKGVRVSWRNHRSDWTTTTLAPRRTDAFTVDAPAVDEAGRIFVPWFQWRGFGLLEQAGFMSTHARAWRTTALWDWALNAQFAAAAVSPNGRAVAMRTAPNALDNSTTVVMRVLRVS